MYTYTYILNCIYNGTVHVESNLCTERFKFKKKNNPHRDLRYIISEYAIYFEFFCLYGLPYQSYGKENYFFQPHLQLSLNVIICWQPRVQLIYKTNSHFDLCFLNEQHKKV